MLNAAREIASGATAIFFGGLPFFYLADRPGLDERFAEAALGAFAKDKAVLPRSRFFARRPKMNAGIAVLALSSKPPDALDFFCTPRLTRGSYGAPRQRARRGSSGFRQASAAR
jgi:hypothetical protein